MNATAARGVDLGIVIVTHDSAGVIEACLASIPAAAADLAVEVIVVDNASTDDTREIVARHGRATLIGNTDNRGFAAGCNAGIAAARGRHLLLLNPDTVLLPGTLPVLVAALEQFPDVGLVAPTLLGSPRKPPRPPLLQGPTLGRMFAAHTPARHVVRLLDRRRWTPVAGVPTAAGYLMGACLLIRGGMVAGSAGLDERYFFYFEDVELSRRAVAAGWKLLWWPEVAVRHHGGKGSREFDAAWRHWQFLRSARRYFASVQPGRRVALLWQLFKVLHLLDLALLAVESGTKSRAYRLLGRRADADRHARRLRLTTGFLRRFAGPFVRS